MNCYSDEQVGSQQVVRPQTHSDPLGYYNSIYAIYTVVAILNSGITDSDTILEFRMWALSLTVVNHLMSSDSDFPPEHIMTVWNYIDRVHSSKSNSARNHLFTHALWYLRCSCSHSIQTGVLKWISDSNNSVTRLT